MPKTYSINGVEVNYEVYHAVMDDGVDPDNFSDLRNIDAPDIPQEHKTRYADDLRNEREGRGITLWTPRRRMLDSIKHKEGELAKKKQTRAEKRQAKIDEWGRLQAIDEAYENMVNARTEYFETQAQNQEDEDSKSARNMALIFIAFVIVMCILVFLSTKLQAPA